MNKLNFRAFLSAVCVMSILAGFSRIDAAPVRFDQVVQIMNATPGKADSGSFSRLSLTSGGYDFLVTSDDDDDDKKKKSAPPLPQDDRVIVETRTDIVLDDVCDCEEEIVKRRGFPKWALLGLAAIPIAIILIRRKRNPPRTPTPPGMTPTPPMTPTPTPPHMTPTPPGMTPTPPPEPVPEPMTILLFGSGLASIGLAARRKFGKKGEQKDEKEEE